MIAIQIDESEVKRLARQRIAELVTEVEAEMVFWDRQELMRRTCMSWNFIQEQFFFDSRFPKHKAGAKWYFPAKEARRFLEQWLSEQS